MGRSVRGSSVMRPLKLLLLDGSLPLYPVSRPVDAQDDAGAFDSEEKSSDLFHKK